MKMLLYMAVNKIYFKCNDSWYVQIDGLAIPILAVILANLWLKQNKFALRQEIPVATEIQEAECKCCRNWYQIKCRQISDDVYASVTEIVWYCESCCRAKNKEKDTHQVKLFLRYLDDIVRTVRGEPSFVFSMPPILFIQICISLQRKLIRRGIWRSWL